MAWLSSLYFSYISEIKKKNRKDKCFVFMAAVTWTILAGSLSNLLPFGFALQSGTLHTLTVSSKVEQGLKLIYKFLKTHLEVPWRETKRQIL